MTSERARFLPYARQMIDDDDIAAVVKVLGSDWLTTGPSISAFEQALSEVVGSRGAAVCSSGTAALHVSALAIGLRSFHDAKLMLFLSRWPAAGLRISPACCVGLSPSPEQAT